MKKITALIVFTFSLQHGVNAQCDSIFIVDIEIPEMDSSNIIVSLNNTSITHLIYLNLILTDDLTGQVIAESSGGYLQLYPNQITTYEVDTTIIFGQWQLYYNLDDIPEISHISVQFQGICDSIPWGSSLSMTELQTSNSFSLYPNPATDVLFTFGMENVTFTIFNSLGKAILNSTSESGQINIQSLPNGIYFFKVEHTGSVYKFIKK